MAKTAATFSLNLGARQKHVTLTRWLLEQLRGAIMDGRIRPGTRLPSTRDLARQYRIARGTVVTAFEQLESDGYLSTRVGGGTWVTGQFATRSSIPKIPPLLPINRPAPLTGIAFPNVVRPFFLSMPAVREFPAKVWARLGSRRLRGKPSTLLVSEDPRGFSPLREAICGYLKSSRAVSCHPDQIVILSGVQQGLDLLGRLLLKPGDPVWLEDPGYFGAAIAFRNAGARIVPVAVDERGLRVKDGRRQSRHARLAYVTPGHQFPLGMTMPLEARLELLEWAGQSRAFIIEDDYDSEFRFRGEPMPSLQSLDSNGSVIFVGTFNKLLFPALRQGYVVLPPSLVEPFLALRFGTDLRCAGLDQAILCDFIVEGHLARHIRRMRDLYSSRLDAFLDAAARYAKGLIEIAPIRAGLHVTGFVRNGMTSSQAEAAARAKGVETMGLHRLALRRTDLNGLVMGFAAYDERTIRGAIAKIAAAVETGRPTSRLETTIATNKL
jgi:GntR family transcriptional regulator / MocR family aminotransferase